MLTRSEIERAKRMVRIEDVIREYTWLIPKRNGQYVCRCLFHEDHTPSMWVYTEPQIFRCYACGAKGDVLAFLRRIEGISLREAVRLCER